jgi:predicted transposase/invertase (TIGR01784 family)
MVLERFIDPKNDFAFKQIFGKEKNKDILIHFLNDILEYQGNEQIISVEFLQTAQDPDIAVYKQSIIDILCKDQNGTQVIIEMQLSKHKGFEKRAQFYAAKAYSSQIIKEDNEHKGLAVYGKLKGVIFLAIANFKMFPEEEKWLSKHKILDDVSYINHLKSFYFIFMELPKFNKKIDQLVTLNEKWAYFFKYAENSSLEEMDHLIGKDFIIKRAFQAIDQASWSEEELRSYEHSQKVRLDNLAVEQQKLQDAKEEGIIEGEILGIEKGKAEGKAEGKTEGIFEGKIEIAKTMIEKGFDEKSIFEITGLTTQEIKKYFPDNHKN